MSAADGTNRCRTFELTVSGPMGPALRAAFRDQRVATVERRTVLRWHEGGSRELDEVVELFDSAQVAICDIRRTEE